MKTLSKGFIKLYLALFSIIFGSMTMGSSGCEQEPLQLMLFTVGFIFMTLGSGYFINREL